MPEASRMRSLWRSVPAILPRPHRAGDRHVAWNFGDIFLTMLALFVWAALIWMFIGVFADVFRRRDLSGAAKAGWVFLFVVLPFLGILIYLVARPAVANLEMPPAEKRADAPYTRLSAADEIEKAGKLQAAGAITAEEFATIKAQALARAASDDTPGLS
jgi:Phospholipase_D-nuclease N-terminal